MNVTTRYLAIGLLVGSAGLGGALVTGASAAATAPGTGGAMAPAGAARYPHAVADPQTTQIVHVLNRMAFGPRPGEVEAVRAMGLRNWIESQLNPDSIDDSEVEAKLGVLPSLKLTPGQLMVAYQYETVERKMQRATKKEEQAAAAAAATTTAAGGQAGDQVITTAPPTLANQFAPARRVPAGRKAKSNEQIMQEGQQDGFGRGIGNQIVGEMDTAKLVRAVESRREFQEVLVDFWSNHFNLDVHKGPVKTLRLADERDVIRPHVLGNFRDMLEASAHSAAMLWYLDNARSTRPITVPPRRGRRALQQTAATPQVRGGLNENYARELMELHTLGVDGGYTQQDVIEVARCFTGWSFNRDTGEFIFHPFLHDNGEKYVMGQRIPAGGGVQDGETVLDMLVKNPHTAHHLAYELCQRLVSDNPPEPLVGRAAQAFTASGGDLKAMTRAIVTSPEFLGANYDGQKIKSPFEYVVSAARATGATVFVPDAGRPREQLLLVADGGYSVGKGNNLDKGRRSTLPRELALMGMPMYACEPPTGYTEDSKTWVSTGALVARLNFALAFTNGTYADVNLPEWRVEGDGEDHEGAVHEVATELLGTDLSPASEATIGAQFPADTPIDVRKLYALVLGSPEFQRR